MPASSANVQLATADDLTPWIELAREVEPLFGPMPDIATHIERAIARGTALVAEDAEGHFAGAALLSRDGQPHRIHWLAVTPSARRQGAGSVLLAAILERWDDGQPIDVITFGEDHPGSAPARAFYAAHGFTFANHAENGPEGGSRERWSTH